MDDPRNSPVIRALAFLTRLVDAGGPVSVSELALRLGLPKTTVHRIASLLEREGFVGREPGYRRLVAGTKLIDLSFACLDASVRQGPSHAILDALCKEVGETCELGILVGNEAVLIDQVGSDQALRLRIGRGDRMPLYCTAVGKILLGMLPKRQRERLIHNLPLKRHTETTITDVQTLSDEIARVRANRLATNNHEYDNGIVGVAVPVVGSRQRVCASLALIAPEARLTVEQALAWVPALRRAAEHMSTVFLADSETSDEPEEPLVSLRST